MRFPKLSMAVAIGTLVAYGWFIWWMVHNAGSPNWTKLTYIYGSVSGIVVLAAGVVLGTAAQQQSVKSSQAEATAAKQESSKMSTDAAVGRSLEDVMSTLREPVPNASTGRAESYASRIIGSGALTDSGTAQTNAEANETLLDFLRGVAATTRARHARPAEPNA